MKRDSERRGKEGRARDREAVSLDNPDFVNKPPSSYLVLLHITNLMIGRGYGAQRSFIHHGSVARSHRHTFASDIAAADNRWLGDQYANAGGAKRAQAETPFVGIWSSVQYGEYAESRTNLG